MMILTWHNLIFALILIVALCMVAMVVMFAHAKPIPPETKLAPPPYYVHPAGKIRGRDGTDLLAERQRYL